MKLLICIFAMSLGALCSSVYAQESVVAANPNIDAQAFLAVAREALQFRNARRVSEAEFLRMSRDQKTIVLDARSTEKYRELHVKGARNLSFPDITAASLADLIPDKETRILIYCNNNFANAGSAFPSKLPSASLNLSTFAALYNYGYRNIYELAPYIDIKLTRLDMIPTP